MHFSITDSEELLDAYGASYMAYKLHCNGLYQGNARYRELCELHDELKCHFARLPSFPPKRLFQLSAMEVSGRRQSLEKYLQNLGQMSEVLHSAALQLFLRRILLKSVGQLHGEANLRVYMLNDNAVELTHLEPSVTCEELLESVGRELKLPAEFTYYFGLFLAREESVGKYSIFRKLAPFELPFALLQLNQPLTKANLRIVIKKAYWDANFDTDLLDSSSKVATSLLFVETVDAINRGWITPTAEQKSMLESLQNRGSRREFVQLARTLKGYGGVRFGAATIDYPGPHSFVRPILTGKELVCMLKGKDQEISFKVTRMRCWRLCFSDTYRNGGPADAPPSSLSIMFEYLMGRDQLQWITLVSEEAIWLSACLQSVVEELLLRKRGLKYEKWGVATRKDSHNGKTEESLSISVTVTRKMTSDNSAFEEIGDEDL